MNISKVLCLLACASLLAAGPQSLNQIPLPLLKLVVAQGSPVADGRNGSNRDSWISVGQQNGAMQPLIYAAVSGDASLAQKYWPVVDVSFSHERSDGSFDYAPMIGTKPFDVRGLPTDEAFWISQSAFALLLLRSSSLGPQYAARIDALRPLYRRAVEWLAEPQQLATMQSVDSGATNRLLIDAQALLLGGLLANDFKARSAGEMMLSKVLARQTPEGYFPEHSGPDTSYNAVSGLALAQMAMFLRDPRLMLALRRAARWEMSRVDPDGHVNTQGNTRTGPGFFTADGRPYRVDSYRVGQMLAMYAVLAGDPQAMDVAQRVAAYHKANPTAI